MTLRIGPDSGTGRRPKSLALRDSSRTSGLNMTPIIDIVFLLIIFFMVVCRFIEAENLPVSVPDNCAFAQSDTERQGQITTVSITQADGQTTFAVDSEKVTPGDGLASRLAELLDARLQELPPDHRTVTLRIDKEISYAHAQHALAGVAASIATDIQMAALKDKRVE